MKRFVVISAVGALALSSLIGGSAASGTSTPGAVAAPPSPTEQVAGPQHWCGSNGVTCADPALNWEELPGFKQAVAQGARIQPYIGHDEPMVQFFSNRPGTGNDVTYRLRLPKDPPTLPRQDGSGGAFNFQ